MKRSFYTFSTWWTGWKDSLRPGLEPAHERDGLRNEEEPRPTNQKKGLPRGLDRLAQSSLRRAWERLHPDVFGRERPVLSPGSTRP